MLSMTSVTNRKPNVSDGIDSPMQLAQGFWINTAFSKEGMEWNQGNETSIYITHTARKKQKHRCIWKQFP